MAMREAIRRVQAWKTAGSRKNRSLRKIWIAVSWRMSSTRSAPAKAGNVAAQQRVAVAEELFQGSPVAGLGEEDEKGLVGGGRLLRM